MKKMAFSGATGFIASHLIPLLEKRGYQIVPLLRGDFEDKNSLIGKLKDCMGVINLAGEPIVKRWSESYKKKLYSSRVDTTLKIVRVFNELNFYPDFFISASAVGIYRNGAVCGEDCGNFRDDFLGKLCVDWENAAFELKDKTRVCVLRIGVVLGKNGGIVKRITPVFKLGLGGKIASGKQGFSWIHIDDLCKAIFFAIENKGMEGIFNAVSPNPVDNLEFTKALGRVLKRPVVFPVPSFALKILFGEGASVLVEGQKAIPKRLIEAGFKFSYPELDTALKQVFYERL